MWSWGHPSLGEDGTQRLPGGPPHRLRSWLAHSDGISASWPGRVARGFPGAEQMRQKDRTTRKGGSSRGEQGCRGVHGGNRAGRGEGSLAREGVPVSDKAVVLATYQKTNAPPKKASDGTWAKRPFGTTALLPPASLIFISASRSPGPRQEAPVRSWEGSDQEWTGLDLAPILWAHKPHP